MYNNAGNIMESLINTRLKGYISCQFALESLRKTLYKFRLKNEYTSQMILFARDKKNYNPNWIGQRFCLIHSHLGIPDFKHGIS